MKAPTTKAARSLRRRFLRARRAAFTTIQLLNVQSTRYARSLSERRFSRLSWRSSPHAQLCSKVSAIEKTQAETRASITKIENSQRELIASQARLTAVLNKLVAPGAEGTGGTKSAPPPPSAH